MNVLIIPDIVSALSAAYGSSVQEPMLKISDIRMLAFPDILRGRMSMPGRGLIKIKEVFPMKRMISLLLVLTFLISVSAAAESAVQVKGITLSETKQLPLAPLVSWRIGAQVKPDNATNRELSWTSSDNSVANVDGDGVVTGVAPGTATITAAAKDGSGVKATLSVRVDNYDLVFFDSKPQQAEYILVPGSRRVRAKVETHCVSIPNVDESILLIGMESKESFPVTPVKAGPDTISVTGSGRDRKIRVFVSPSIFPGSGAAPLPKESGGEAAEILFLNIPWGSSLPDAKKVLEGQNKKLKKPAQRNDFVRVYTEDEVSFGTCTALYVGLDFSYEPGTSDFKTKNALFKGLFYFDPATPVDQIRLAVSSVYGLDNGAQKDGEYVWSQGDVKLTLILKDKFNILEVEKTSGK